MQTWTTSDHHFGHDNAYVFTYGFCPLYGACTGADCLMASLHEQLRMRPQFDNAAQADEFMITQWNERVKDQDHVYHLGDVAFGQPALQLVRRLRGKKRLVLGNHDGGRIKMQAYADVGFQKIMSARIWGDLMLTHIPVHESSIRGAVNVHGHTHQQPAYSTRYLNVCVEQTNYAPIPIEIAEAQARRVIEARGDIRDHRG